MKKILLVLGILAIGAIGFADAKSDYESALNLSKEGKTEQAIKVLEGVVKGKDKEYIVKSNFQLGYYYAQLNDINSVKKYFEPISNDNKYLTSVERGVVLEILYQIAFQEKNYTLAEKYIKNLNTLAKGENAGYVAEEIALDFLQNKNSSAVTKYNQAIKSNNDNEFKASINYSLGVFFSKIGNLEEAKKYLLEVYKLGLTNSLEVAGNLLVNIELNQNKVVEAEKLLIDLDKKFNGKNVNIIRDLGILYYKTSNFVKSEEQFKRLETILPEDNGIKIILLGIYENLKKESNVKKYYNDIKAKGKEEANEVMAYLYLGLNDLQLTEKYLKKAITEDKKNNLRIGLIKYYASVGKIEEAKKEAKEAVKLKVEGAAEILKQLEQIKK